MKKKLLALIFACVASCSLFAFAGCNIGGSDSGNQDGNQQTENQGSDGQTQKPNDSQSSSGGGAQNPDDPVEQDPPEQQDPPVKDDALVTNANIIKFLDENCKEKIVTLNPNPTLTDISCVNNDQWYITKNADGKIISAEYGYEYIYGESSGGYYMVNKVEFAEPVDLKKFNSVNLKNVSYTECFRTNKYNPTIQTENADLTNAICDKLFGEKTGATRFIIIGNVSVDATLQSVANEFTIIEISNNTIKQKTLSIKESSSNDEYLSKLNNPSDYRIVSSKEYKLTGEKLTVE